MIKLVDNWISEDGIHNWEVRDNCDFGEYGLADVEKIILRDGQVQIFCYLEASESTLRDIHGCDDDDMKIINDECKIVDILDGEKVYLVPVIWNFNPITGDLEDWWEYGADAIDERLFNNGYKQNIIEDTFVKKLFGNFFELHINNFEEFLLKVKLPLLYFTNELRDFKIQYWKNIKTGVLKKFMNLIIKILKRF